MPGSVTLFQHKDYKGRSVTLHLDLFAERALHTLESTDVHDDVSSARWDLPNDVVVVLYEYDDGTGRSYQIRPGRGQDPSTHNEDFKVCATTWRWSRLSSSHPVLEAFGWIGTRGRVSGFDSGSVDLGGGGHLQGVALVDDATLAISASGTKARLLFVRWPVSVGSGTGRVLPSSMEIGVDPLAHPSGLQIADGVLAVGIEDISARDHSRIRFFDVRNPSAITALDWLALDRPAPGQAPARERWTAGAVGLVLAGSSFLLLVGSWHSAHLDMYRSTTRDLRDAACRFEHVAEWSESTASRAGWIDGNWGSYQSLNLLADDSGRVFFIGGNRNSGGHDWIDLYHLQMEAGSSEQVTKIDKRHLTCHDGACFEHAGGIVEEGTVLHAIATEGNLHDTTTMINIFDGLGGLGGRRWSEGSIAPNIRPS